MSTARTRIQMPSRRVHTAATWPIVLVNVKWPIGKPITSMNAVLVNRECVLTSEQGSFMTHSFEKEQKIVHTESNAQPDHSFFLSSAPPPEFGGACWLSAPPELGAGVCSSCGRRILLTYRDRLRSKLVAASFFISSRTSGLTPIFRLSCATNSSKWRGKTTICLEAWWIRCHSA